MTKNIVLAIDAGTTGNRVIAFDREGHIAANSYYEFPQIYPKAGWVEHDPLEILRTTIQALKEVLQAVGAEAVVSIGITNQRETVVLWDKNTGKPVYNAIVWQCRRTEKICSRMRKFQGAIKKKTGLFMDPYFSASKIKWIFDNVQGVRAKARKGELMFGTIDTWLLWNLTGRKVHATEPSNASRTMLFDIGRLEFDQEILQRFAIPRNVLPEVRDSDACFGVTEAAVTGREIPIIGILGDQQAALFAHGGWRTGVVKATYGTGIFILAGTGRKMAVSKTLLTTIAWKRGREVMYALEGSLFMGGAAIQWLRDNLKILSSAAESEIVAKNLMDNEGVYFVPAFQGLGAPYWDPLARGLLIGMTRKSNRDHIVRAVLESLAYQVRDVFDEMKKSFKNGFKILSVDGGACRNDLLMQFQTDLLRLPIERACVSEFTALGAAGISGVATGFWKPDDLQRIRMKEKTFVPVMPKQRAERFYLAWKEAVRRAHAWAN